MTPQYTCITCRVGFRDPEIQREHYKTDWHRYNLKRKVAELDPVVAEEFQKRVLQQREADKQKSEAAVSHCKPCSKSFSTKNSYENHVNSKKHKMAEERFSESVKMPENDDVVMAVKEEEKAVVESRMSSIGSDFVVVDSKIEKSSDEIETDSEFEEVDSDEWDEETEGGSLIKPSECLFCPHGSRSMVKNLRHMTEAHSFFIPDPEFCVDIPGMLLYLGEKISRGYMCIWCNDKGRAFRSQEAAQGHMKDKGHCKAVHEGPALAEYTDFYDYSSSYPDHVEGDEEMEVEAEDVTMPTYNDDEEEYQLVLPSGAVIGHRSLLRYYKQKLKPDTALVVRDKKSDKLKKVLRQYRMLGWAPQQAEIATRKARDIKYMQRVQKKWHAQLGIKANKMQHHYREQVNF